MRKRNQPMPVAIDAVMRDVPPGTVVVGDGSGVDASGFPSIFLIFASRADRDAFRGRHLGTWVVLPDRACLLDHEIIWIEDAGYGVELATFRPQDIGKPRAARVLSSA